MSTRKKTLPPYKAKSRKPKTTRKVIGGEEVMVLDESETPFPSSGEPVENVVEPAPGSEPIGPEEWSKIDPLAGVVRGNKALGRPAESATPTKKDVVKRIEFRNGALPQDVADQLRTLAGWLDGLCGEVTNIAMMRTPAKFGLKLVILTTAPDPDCGKPKGQSK
jgi:hypothetical protein